MAPRRTERGTHDYVQHGTTSPFAAQEVATGKVIGTCLRRHRQQEFIGFLDNLDAALVREQGVAVPVVLDNDVTYDTPSVKPWCPRHPTSRLHFMPTSATWLSQVERVFAEVTEKRIRR